MAAKKKVATKTVAKKAGDKLTPATKAEASGALIEKEIAEGSVPDHPAVDRNPRAGVPPESNQIDFNDPTMSQKEAVAENLDAQK